MTFLYLCIYSLYRVVHPLVHSVLLTSNRELCYTQYKEAILQGTFILMSTKCSVQPDGPPCIQLAQPIQDVHHNLKFEIYQAQHGDSIIKILLRDFTTTCLSCNLISDQDTDWHLTFWLFSKLNLRSLSTYELLSCNYVTPSTIPVQLCSFSRNIETQCKMQIVISNVIQFDVI